MKLYKFRNVSKLDFVLDIILNERLYCPLYKNMNDPFEGLFASTIHLNPQDRLKFIGLLCSPPDKLTVHRSVEDLLLEKIDNVRVCSLSASVTDVRMWSHYSDSHTGIAIEIDFSDSDAELHEVKYEKFLPHFDYNLLSSPTAHEVLSHKTKHWGYEEEYRIITDSEYWNIKGQISAIVCGIRIPDDTLNILSKVVPAEIPIYRSSLNKHTVKIQREKHPLTR